MYIPSFDLPLPLSPVKGVISNLPNYAIPILSDKKYPFDFYAAYLPTSLTPIPGQKHK